MSHRVLGRGFGLFHEQTEDEEEYRENHAYAQAGPPDGAVMPVMAGSGNYVRHKSCSRVNLYSHGAHKIQELVNKPPITNP